MTLPLNPVSVISNISRVETEIAMDSIAEFLGMYVALRKRHGRRFQALEKKFIRWAETEHTLKWRELQEGVVVYYAPESMSDLMAECHRLGVHSEAGRNGCR